MSDQLKMFYKGKTQDFILFVDSTEAVKNYLNNNDNTIPLSDVVSRFDVYRNITGNGSEGMLEVASNQELNEEFGDFKDVETDIIPFILKHGEFQHSTKKIEKKGKYPV